MAKGKASNVEIIANARVQLHRAMEMAEQRGDTVAYEDARRAMISLGAIREDLERPRADGRRPYTGSRVASETSPAERLFLDKPAEAEKRIERLIGHFRHAEYVFYASRPTGIPTPRELVWLLLQDAMHTARNLRDEERAMVSRVATVMPATRDTIDEAYQRELSRLLDGMAQYDATEVRQTPNETAVDRMVDILDLLRFVVSGRKGRDVLRLKRCVLARAAGLSLEQCGRIFDRHRIDFDRRAMHELKSRVVGQILAGIERDFGLVRTSRSFRRLTVREIERRKKLRKMNAERGETDAG